MDKLDFKILQELEHNARKTNSQIAKALKTSPQRIKYRIESLELKGIIGGYYAMINFGRLGYSSYRTHLRFTNLNQKVYLEIIDYLKSHPRMLWLVECGSRWDLIVNFMVQNPVEYEQIISELKDKFPMQIQNYDVLITVRGLLFGRDYYFKKMRAPSEKKFFESDINHITINNHESQILQILSKDGRMNVVDIAAKTNLSVNTVIKYMRGFTKSGLILKYMPLIHLDKTPYSAYKVLLNLHNRTNDLEKSLISFLESKANVFGCLNLIGPWNFEAEIEVESEDFLREICRELREKFPGLIKDLEILPLYHEYGYNYFPSSL